MLPRGILRGVLLLTAGVSVLSAGCSSVPIDLRRIAIRSDPPGAEVLANGKKIGVTPLTIVPDRDFPPVMDWSNLVYQAKGVLTLRKAGCKPYSEPVNDSVLSKDISVRLDCSGPVAAAPAQSEPPAPSVPPAVAPVSSGTEPRPAVRPAVPRHRLSVEARLRRLEKLHKDGLITDREYRTIRERILSGL